MNDGAVQPTVASRRKRQATLKSALRKLKPMDRRHAQFRRKNPRSTDDQMSFLDDRLDHLGVDARESHENENLMLGLQDIRGRLPGQLLSGQLDRSEEFALQPLYACQRFASLRPHPIAADVISHCCHLSALCEFEESMR